MEQISEAALTVVKDNTSVNIYVSAVFPPMWGMSLLIMSGDSPTESFVFATVSCERSCVIIQDSNPREKTALTKGSPVLWTRGSSVANEATTTAGRKLLDVITC